MHIGQNIKFLRKKQGLNQTQLGEALGITKGAVSGYENGSSIPGVETLIKIAQLLEISVDDLIFRNIEKQGTSGDPAPKGDELEDQTLIRLNELLETRVRELEREIKQDNPDLAKKLGIK